jgi:hypothetical protein
MNVYSHATTAMLACGGGFTITDCKCVCDTDKDTIAIPHDDDDTKRTDPLTKRTH